MKVLVVNDDSIHHNNLELLVNELKKYYKDILVVAPETEQSAVSHKINIRDEVILKEYPNKFEGVKAYSINSTPADCVKFAILALKYDFDICFSGINNGLNIGEDLKYSGTVSGAVEAYMANKYGIALSLDRNTQVGFIKGFEMFMEDFNSKDIYKEHKCFNVNFPNNPKGIYITSQGTNDYKYWFEKIGDNLYLPKAEKQYQTGINVISDHDAYLNDYISVTPITFDMTDLNIYNKFK